MNKKNNLRFQENENIMIDVFVELLKRKPFEKISVKDICDESLVNRTTFYAHFQDIFELKEHAEQRFEKELLNELEINNEINHKELIKQIIKIVKEKKEYYQIYFNGLGYSRMKWGFDTLIDLGIHQYNHRILNNKNNSFIDYQFSFFFNGMVSILSRWLNHDCDMDENELAELIFTYWPVKENFKL